MPTRITIAGFVHETNTFCAESTGIDKFIAQGYFRGDEILHLAGTNTVLGGMIDAIKEDPDLEAIPIVSASAIPGGVVTAEVVNQVHAELAAGLEKAKPDIVLLSLHGAMVSELDDDGEGATLRTAREVVGPEVPVIAVLDLHLNLSEAMVELADLLLPYDTYPHIDMAEKGREAVSRGVEIARGIIEPATAMVRVPMLSHLPTQRTAGEPTRSLMERVFEVEGKPGVLNAGIGFGFPYADIPIAAMSVLVTTDNDPHRAEALAEEIAVYLRSVREEFRPRIATVEEAIHAAMLEEFGPVVLADLGDNPGGGASCDGTAILWALIDLGAKDAAVATIVDPEVVELAHSAGVGGYLNTFLGAKTDDLHGYPVPIDATVVQLSDGQFVYEGPMRQGATGSLGKTAVLRCRGRHENTVDVIVCERRVQPVDLAIFRSQGIEPTEKRILALKSSVHFRAAFEPIASRVIEVDTPGLTAVDFTRFPFQRLSRPLWPFDEIAD